MYFFKISTAFSPSSSNLIGSFGFKSYVLTIASASMFLTTLMFFSSSITEAQSSPHPEVHGRHTAYHPSVYTAHFLWCGSIHRQDIHEYSSCIHHIRHTRALPSQDPHRKPLSSVLYFPSVWGFH